MRRWLPWLLLAVLAAAFWLAGTSRPTTSLPAITGPIDGVWAPAADAPQALPSPPRGSVGLPDGLPAEALETVELIRRGGPFPHRQDGGVFGNREGRLPRQPRGWYREYTVDTPGLQHRGARRIVTGGSPPAQWYYTDDHYDSFRRFNPDGALR